MGISPVIISMPYVQYIRWVGCNVIPTKPAVHNIINTNT